MQGPPPRLLSPSSLTRRSLYRTSGDWADSPAGAPEAAEPADCRLSGGGLPGLSAPDPQSRGSPPTLQPRARMAAELRMVLSPAARPKRPGSWAYPRRQLKVQRKRAAQSRGPLLPAAQAPEPRVISSSARVTCLGKPVAPGLASSARLGLRRLQPPRSSLPESQPPRASQTVRTHGVLRLGRAAGSSGFSPALWGLNPKGLSILKKASLVPACRVCAPFKKGSLWGRLGPPVGVFLRAHPSPWSYLISHLAREQPCCCD